MNFEFEIFGDILKKVANKASKQIDTFAEK